jgi:hypothetical protein
LVIERQAKLRLRIVPSPPLKCVLLLRGHYGDRTNNATERVIGLTYEIRAKSIRGFKSWDKVLSHPYLLEYLRGDEGICDLRKVV